MKNWTVQETSITGESLLQMQSTEPSGGGGMSFATRSVQMATEDARLCAAAPDLLEACQYVLDMLDHAFLPGPCFFSIAEKHAIRKAVKKAQGGNIDRLAGANSVDTGKDEP